MVQMTTFMHNLLSNAKHWKHHESAEDSKEVPEHLESHLLSPV